jgi:hypothetical protein
LGEVIPPAPVPPERERVDLGHTPPGFGFAPKGKARPEWGMQYHEVRAVHHLAVDSFGVVVPGGQG